MQHDAATQALLEAELSRLEVLTDVQLYEALVAMEDDPAPRWVKDLVARKINSIFNQRIGLSA